MARRQDVDLIIVLEDPRCARQWIADFDWGTDNPPKRYMLDLDTFVYFDKMTDAQSVMVARAILCEIVMPMEMKNAQLARDLNELV